MWNNKLQYREKSFYFFIMAILYFTSIVKKEIINDYFTSQKSSSQYNKGSFIPFFFQNTQFEFNQSDLCRYFFIYLQSIKYYKHTQKKIVHLGNDVGRKAMFYMRQ